MRKTKIKTGWRILKNFLILDFILLFAAFLIFKPFDVAFGDKVFADELNSAEGVDTGAETMQYPYAKTFVISAYYSPLPCQQRYYTGGYEREIALNGRGVSGADGTSVYPGMIAAPRTYPFGTKMDIPGIGIVAVHDRGGAIVAAGSRSNTYDRLDIWMGYGDKGLVRALNWGKKTVDVAVYGINESISEQVSLGDYSASEATPNDCGAVVATDSAPVTEGVSQPIVDQPVVNKSIVSEASASQPVVLIETVKSVAFLTDDLNPGDKGDKVRSLQQELKKLNLFRTDISGFYGDTTKHAVFKFQQTQGLIMDEKSQFAGFFGPKTRKSMNKLVAASSYNETRIAAATETYQRTMLAQVDSGLPKRTLISVELRYGMRGPEVAALQKFLMNQGYFDGKLVTEYYGPVTQNAVANFQKAHKIITAPSDTGAGYVGPTTLELINTLS